MHRIPVIDVRPLSARKSTVQNKEDVTWNRVSKNERKNSHIKGIYTLDDIDFIDVDDVLFSRLAMAWANVTEQVSQVDELIAWGDFGLNMIEIDMQLRAYEPRWFKKGSMHKIKGMEYIDLPKGYRLILLVGQENETQIYLWRKII